MNISSKKYVNSTTPPHGHEGYVKRATLKAAVHEIVHWLSLVILGALALEGSKQLVKGGTGWTEVLSFIVIFLLFYIHLT